MNGLYPLLWRWHFLVGLLAAPILLIVSVTGALYAFEPQLRPLVEPYQQHRACSGCPELDYARILDIARQAAPERPIHELVDPGPGYSVQVHLDPGDGDATERVLFIDPHSGEILHRRDAEAGFFNVVLRLHRTLLAGEPGRYLTELTISWVFVTLLLGLLLWWPRRKRGPGGWWPRLHASGRPFWRDLHSVTGFYLLPPALLVTFTGLFFSPLAEKSMLGGAYLTNQLPALFLSPPKVEDPPGENAERLPVDPLIDDFLARSGAEHFDVHLPQAPEGAVVITTHLAHDVWHLRQTHYNPYNGARLGEMGWDELAPGAKALILFFPLHTGNVLGLGTQIVACLTALLTAGITVTGLVLWWRRRRPGELGLPPRPARRHSIPGAAWALLAAFAVLLPAFGVSLVLVLAASGLRALVRRRAVAATDSA